MEQLCIDSVENVEKYFATIQPLVGRRLVKASKLAGGLANYVFRCVLDDESSVILKYTSDHLSSNSSIKFPQSRYIVETNAYRILGNLTAGSVTRVPRLLFADEENYVKIIEDAGEHVVTLQDYLKNNETNDFSLIDFIAVEVAKFSKFLSNESKITPSNYKEKFDNSLAEEHSNSYYKFFFESNASKFGLESELAETAEHLEIWLGKSEDTSNVLCMGDFWPNSILIDVERKLVWIIDWEMARFGKPLKDLEQLMGNLWIMKQNPVRYNSPKVIELMKRIEIEFFEEEKDWRVGCGPNAAKNFVCWAVNLVMFDHWGIEDKYNVVIKAIKEAENFFN